VFIGGQEVEQKTAPKISPSSAEPVSPKGRPGEEAAEKYGRYPLSRVIHMFTVNTSMLPTCAGGMYKHTVPAYGVSLGIEGLPGVS